MSVLSQKCKSCGPYVWENTVCFWKCQVCGFYMEQSNKDKIYNPNFVFKQSKTCDCGGLKANTTHARWCSAYE